MNWKQTAISCLDTALQEVQNSEQTQEIKVPDGVPDVGKVLCAWGQPILRGKQWETGRVTLSAGMMVWVLYDPEEGSTAQCLETWVPFQMSFDLPDTAREGEIQARCLTRFVDARSVSPRKLMVRCGLGCQVQAFSPMEREVYQSEGDREGVQLKTVCYPLRLYREAGEKTFTLDESLTVPDSMAQPEQILCCRMTPQVMEKKVLGTKVVFRGCGNLHVLWHSSEGTLEGMDFELPFSQFSELNGDHSIDAQAEVALCPTNLEVSMDEEGGLHFLGSLTAQYAITDKVPVEVVEDGYCPGRELNLQMGVLELPVVLETRRDTIPVQQTLDQEARQIVDTVFWPDFPRQRRGEDQAQLLASGAMQVLSYDAQGQLQSGSTRWEEGKTLAAHEDTVLTAVPQAPELGAQAGGQVSLRGELPLEITATAQQKIPMVMGLTLGKAVEPDPDRPSLILRRAGKESLWDIAKASGSTMEAIRQANGLQEDAEPGRMLLIPVP